MKTAYEWINEYKSAVWNRARSLYAGNPAGRAGQDKADRREKKLREQLIAKLEAAESELATWKLNHLSASQRIVELEALLDFNPRAKKLARKSKRFAVVAWDEEYFPTVMSLIRSSQIALGRWTDEDEIWMHATVSMNRRYFHELYGESKREDQERGG